MASNNGTESTTLSTESCNALQVIEISSDSEDDVFCQKQLSKPGSMGKCKEQHPRSTSENDVIELTDSDSSDILVLPNILSPLVKGPRKMESTSSRQRPLSKEFISLYADTSDDEESDMDCILLLNDPPGSKKLIRNISPTKGRDISKGNPLLDSPKKVTVREVPRATGKSTSKSARKLASKAEEEARRQNDCLPKGTALEWSKRLLTTAGRARWHRSREGVHTTKIELASKILDNDERIRNTLAHEMCHLACWVIDNQPREGHGQLFRSWANKVMQRHPEIHISTRHDYEISYPYEWKCEKCSKIYGRYSKSIRPDECVCGACRVGKLIPQFAQRKPMTPRVNRMAMVKSRDSPHPVIESSTKNSLVMLQLQATAPSDTVDRGIAGLVDALMGVSINDTKM